MLHHALRSNRRRFAQYLGYVKTDNTAYITIPNTSKIGDIAILVDASYGGLFSTPSAVIPSGWTEFIGNFSGWNVRHCFSWKVLVAGDPGRSITGMPQTGSSWGGACTKIMTVYRITNGRGAPSLVDIESFPGDTDPPAHTVNVSNYGYGSITCAYAYGDGMAFSSGSFDNSNVANSNYNVFGYKVNNINIADNTIDVPNTPYQTTLQTWLIIDQ